MCPWIRVGCDYNKVADRRSLICRIFPALYKKIWAMLAHRKNLHKWGEALFLFLPAVPSFNLAVKKPQCYLALSPRGRFPSEGQVRALQTKRSYVSIL